MSREIVIYSLIFNLESFVPLLLVVRVLYYCFCPLSVQPRRRYVKTNKDKGDDEEKRQKNKNSPLSCVGEETATKACCPSVLTDY